MEKLPKGQPAQYEKLVRENGGFSGYSAKETSGSQQVTPTGAPGTSPTHSHRLVRKSISSGCHIETPTSLAYDQAFELHQKKKKKKKKREWQVMAPCWSQIPPTTYPATMTSGS